MENRKYTMKDLSAIKSREYTIQENGMNVLIKPLPYTDEDGVMDKAVYDSIAPNTKGVKGFLVKTMMKRKPKKQKSPVERAEGMRKMFNGIKSVSITKGVNMEEKHINTPEATIAIRIYTPMVKADKLQPVLYYIHGGGFVAGSMDVVDEMCRFVAEQTGFVVVQPCYRLAPEHPYPAGLNDCYHVLEWIYKNAAEFGGDTKNICISGDSAGGNFATVCAMKTRDDKTNMVKAQALFYPAVDVANMSQNVKDEYSLYIIKEEQRPVLDFMMGIFGGDDLSLTDLLKVEDTSDVYVSPLLADLQGMPPTLMIFGEYDFLRGENEKYAHKLNSAGVKTKTIRYKGLMHGFADQVGVCPQAEDSLLEVGAFMKETCI